MSDVSDISHVDRGIDTSEPEGGVLYIVSTPIGNLEDISFRAVKILSNVDLIAAEDTRTTGNLLKHYNIHTRCISYFSHNEKRRIPYLIDELFAGRSIAVVSDAGTPAISDPAALLISEAIKKNIRVVAIPGACAALASIVASGLPTDKFVFEGFLPSKKRRSTRIKELSDEQRTIILYESPHRILKLLGELQSTFGNRRIALCRELTKKFEEIIRGTIDQVIEYMSVHPVRGECVVVIEGNNRPDRQSTASIHSPIQ